MDERKRGVHFEIFDRVFCVNVQSRLDKKQYGCVAVTFLLVGFHEIFILLNARSQIVGKFSCAKIFEVIMCARVSAYHQPEDLAGQQ